MSHMPMCCRHVQSAGMTAWSALVLEGDQLVRRSRCSLCLMLVPVWSDTKEPRRAGWRFNSERSHGLFPKEWYSVPG